MESARLLIVAALGAAVCGGASRATAQVRSWQPVDQRVADLTVLSESLRAIEPGLRPPSDFARVYRVPGRDDLFARVQGGLYAVFPQSVYARRRGAVTALVPNNTVMFIGPPTAEALAAWGGPPPITQPAAAEGTDHRVDSRVSHRIQEGPVSQPRPHPVAGAGRARNEPPRNGTVVNDAAYRAVRLRRLLRRAAEAEMAATKSVNPLRRPRPVVVILEEAEAVELAGEILDPPAHDRVDRSVERAGRSGPAAGPDTADGARQAGLGDLLTRETDRARPDPGFTKPESTVVAHRHSLPRRREAIAPAWGGFD